MLLVYFAIAFEYTGKTYVYNYSVCSDVIWIRSDADDYIIIVVEVNIKSI